MRHCVIDKRSSGNEWQVSCWLSMLDFDLPLRAVLWPIPTVAGAASAPFRDDHWAPKVSPAVRGQSPTHDHPMISSDEY